MTLVFRASAAHRSIPGPAGPEKDETPEDVRAWLAGLRGPGGSSEAIRDQPFARSISSSRSKSSALRPALDQDGLPSRLVDERFGIPFAIPADIPSGHHPEGLRFPGVRLG